MSLGQKKIIILSRSFEKKYERISEAEPSARQTFKIYMTW